MWVIALTLSLGQITFVEQPLSEVYVGNVTPFTGQVNTNFLHADMNYDGEMDLLLTDKLLLQEKGVYDMNAAIPLPEPIGPMDADCYRGALFYRSAQRLIVYEFEQGAWRTVLSQSLESPDEPEGFTPQYGNTSQIGFVRFLHDIDADGSPEIVAIDHSGIRLFRRKDAHYVAAGVLKLPTTIAVSRSTPQPIWPQTARKIMFPEQQMSSRIVFESGQVRMVSVEERQDTATRYLVRSTPLSLDEAANFQEGASRLTRPEMLPSHLRPCRLNDDDILDFAGGRWVNAETGPLPAPLYELWATLDGGETFEVRRATAQTQFRPHCAFVDYDGDGDMDMVTESTLWARGGIRERITRFLTESTLEHGLHIYEQKNGHFAESPTIQATLNIDLEAPPAQPQAMLSRYEAGNLLHITGDMDGDGIRDILVRNAPDEMSLYRGLGWKGFSRKPAWSHAIAPENDVAVADLNGDGLSDLYVFPRVPAEGSDGPSGSAFYAQRRHP